MLNVGLQDTQASLPSRRASELSYRPCYKHLEVELSDTSADFSKCVKLEVSICIPFQKYTWSKNVKGYRMTVTTAAFGIIYHSLAKRIIEDQSCIMATPD